MGRNKQGPLEADTASSVHPVSRIGPYWAFISSTNFDKLYVFYHLKIVSGSIVVRCVKLLNKEKNLIISK